ncbi:MAG: ribose-phosphate diphosphokinase [Anaerolineae bacterium]
MADSAGRQGALILAGNANPDLARSVALLLETPLGAVTVSTFRDGETQIVLHEDVRGRDVFVFQPTSPPVNQHLFELLLLLDAVRRSGANRRIAVIPYYGYARQERRATPQEPISARLVADLVTAAGADQVIVMDLTAPAIEGFFDLPVEHLHAAEALAAAFAGAAPDKVTIVAPDIGAVKRAEAFQRLVAPGAPLAVVLKERPRPDEVRAGQVVGEVRGRHAILVDDMISTGGTLIGAAEALLARGARSVSSVATHAVLVPGAREALTASPLERIVVGDTIPVRPDGKIEVVSVAPLLAEAIARIHGQPSPACALAVLP